MGVTKKPRRKYRPRPVTLDPIALAKRRAGVVPRDEVQEVMQPVHAAFNALRAGVATEMQWMVLAGTVELALHIERQGVVRGILGHLEAAEQALAAIRVRCMATGQWRGTALYFQELDAIDTAITLHERAQLKHLGQGELLAALDKAEACVRAQGGRVVTLAEAQRVTGAEA